MEIRQVMAIVKGRPSAARALCDFSAELARTRKTGGGMDEKLGLLPPSALTVPLLLHTFQFSRMKHPDCILAWKRAKRLALLVWAGQKPAILRLAMICAQRI